MTDCNEAALSNFWKSYEYQLLKPLLVKGYL